MRTLELVGLFYKDYREGAKQRSYAKNYQSDFA
jgi:hypothetical protein